jgi:hypothetical protein
MNRATILIGVVLAMWWVWPPPDEPQHSSSGNRRVTRPRIRTRRFKKSPKTTAVQTVPAAVAQHAADITCDLLELERRPAPAADPEVVARAIVRKHSPHVPPFIEEGIVRHVCTYFDGTWTNEAELEADAARVAADVYAMLFVDLLVYSEDPMIVGKLAPLYRAFAHEGKNLFDFFEQDRLRDLWRTHLNRFARFRWTIPPVYR